MVFLDIKSAFDRVWHQGLVHKLSLLGVSGSLLNWLRNYLLNRNQKVVISGVSSTPRNITAGVPQGSILGPLLFLIYINDFGCNLNSESYLFVDDTSLLHQYLPGNHLPAINLLNQDLVKISDWARDWRIIFNTSKTILMNFSRKNHKRY